MRAGSVPIHATLRPLGQNAGMTTIAMYGAGHMGAGLGWALREGGGTVITTLAGRSARTARLAGEAGLALVDNLDTLVGTADVVLVVTPPAVALDAANALATAAARCGASTRPDGPPLVADLNAIAPTTVERIAAVYASAGLDFVDGSISGGPPTVRPGARIYLSGSRAADVAGLPWRHVTAVDLGAPAGAASALKMCTASVYKGLVGLFGQAMRTADHYGVLDPVIADLRGAGYDLTSSVAVAATKADRYVPEMREIAAAQRGADMQGALFDAFAEIYAQIAGTDLATGDPESVDLTISADEVVRRMRA